MNSILLANKSNIKLDISEILVFGLFIPLLLVYHTIDEVKQIFYFMPFFGFITVIIIYLFFGNLIDIKLNFSYLIIAIIYLCSCAISLMLVAPTTEIYWTNVWRDIVITTGPLLLFSFKNLTFKHQHIIALFFASFVCYVIWIKFDINFNLMHSIIKSNFDYKHEYHFGTVAGIFVLYFIYKKDYIFTAIAIFFMLLVNKRANLLGIFASIGAFYLFIEFFKLDRTKKGLVVFLLIYFVCFYLIAMNLEFVTNFVLDISGKTDVKPDKFLTGRLFISQLWLPEVYNRGWINYLLGNGIGQSEYYLWKTIQHEIYYFYTKPFLAHNDLLKLHYDIGLVGVFVYFMVMYYLYCGSKPGLMMFFNFVALFLIDNTLVFSYNIIISCIVARVSEDSKPFWAGVPFKIKI
ncbi:MAG: hypothetical protein EAZ53_10385 [Bacteroidetes bacterium]|nr:MAG: hypothetical protein EAZ53_10385 [Bacteroidota bacterium]